jgi:hypothetical protein
MSDKFAGGVRAGSTSVSLTVVLRKTTDSTELAGVAYGSVTASYRRQGQASAVIPTSALSAITAAWTAGGWFEADAVNRPGEYRLDVPDAAFATGADHVTIAVKVAGAYVFYERLALESKNAVDVSNQLAAGVTVATNADKAGYALASSGLDAIPVETGINVRQALAPILAAAAGTLTGAAGNTIAIAAALAPATNRITAIVDGAGNRTSITLNLPT